MSERLVELLGPRPGQTIVDLAAGPGDTGFLAAPLVRPGGRLVTTDVAPEMLDTARRRAAELGLDDVEFLTEDIAALSFDDATVDGILCRWGLMLVPDMDAAAAEIRRVLRAEGRAALAVWGSPDDNDWMTAPGRSALELGLVERPDPVPGRGQVILKKKAFSINYRDLLVVNGVGRWKPPLGRVPLSDGG